MLERKSDNKKMKELEPRGGKRGDPRDTNEIAFSVVQQAIGEQPKQEPQLPATKKQKNAAAMTLGRLGGLKGGKARAEKLTPEQRVAIAKKAAEKRWKDN